MGNKNIILQIDTPVNIQLEIEENPVSLTLEVE